MHRHEETFGTILTFLVITLSAVLHVVDVVATPSAAVASNLATQIPVSLVVPKSKAG
jgi:anti-sigma factor RsiW